MRARVVIFDVAGRQVRMLVDERTTPGEHSVVWDGRDDAGREVGTGIYVYRLTTDAVVNQKKLVLFR